MAKTTLRGSPSERFARLTGRSGSEEFWALRNVSVEVAEGEILGIIGRNGSGKSTLLKVLSRIVQPTSGKAILRGKTVSLLEVGTGFHPELTGHDNIYLNGSILGMTRRETSRKLDDIIEFAGVERFLDTPVKFYSSGMYVRLAFAVAAHLDADIMLVDEVLAVGDNEFQRRCLGRMGEVARQGRTVLFVSHNMASIRNLCTAALWLDEGQIRQLGTTASVIHQYMAGGNSNSSADFQIEDRHYETRGEPLEFRRVSLLDPSGRPKQLFHLGESLTVRLVVECKSAFRAATLGFVIQASDGSNVTVSHHTDDPKRHADTLFPGVYTFEAHISNVFSPGHYWIGVGGHEAITGDRGSAYLPNLISFEVLPYDLSGQSLSDREPAPVIVPTGWTVTKHC